MDLTSIVLVILGVFVAAFGGYVSSNAKLHQIIFIAAGALMIIFALIQWYTNARDLSNRDTKINEMNNTLQNMQGQLTAFREIGARLLTPSTTMPQQPHETPKTIKDLSNAELLTKVIQFANNMRDFETNFMKEERDRDFSQRPLKGTEEEISKQWNQQVNISIQRRMEYDNEFRKRFLGEAMSYRDELTRRLNLMPPSKKDHISFSFDGVLTGPYPINGMATYLEKLARQLP